MVIGAMDHVVIEAIAATVGRIEGIEGIVMAAAAASILAASTMPKAMATGTVAGCIVELCAPVARTGGTVSKIASTKS